MRVLIVEDDPTTLHSLKALITKWGYEVLTTSSGKSAFEIVKKSNFPIIVLSDYVIPDIDGMTLCKSIRDIQAEDYNYTYFIISTEPDESKTSSGFLLNGADDFIKKPFDFEEVHARLRVAERITELNIRLKQANEYLQMLSTTDPLTGILNRRETLKHLEGQIEKGKRMHFNLSIAMFDIDFFKKVNDTYGHPAGDEVLKKVVEIVKMRLRKYDIFGRIGGEEFMLILPGSSLDDAVKVCERCRLEVKNTGIPTEKEDIFVTVSFGVTEFDGQPLEKILSAVDKNLYEAKNNGRDMVVAG